MCKCMSVVLIFKICALGVWVVKGKDCVGSGECLNTVIFNLFIVTFLPVCLLISDSIVSHFGYNQRGTGILFFFFFFFCFFEDSGEKISSISLFVFVFPFFFF